MAELPEPTPAAVEAGIEALVKRVYVDVNTLSPAEIDDGVIRGDVQAILLAAYPAIRDQVLCELAAAGRLLPEGCSVRSQFAVRWYFSKTEPLTVADWDCDSLEHARKAALEPPSTATRGEIRAREYWTSPWSVVEPVEVPGGKNE